jgi:multiple sugar transport system substrate-binding protein
MSRLTPTAPTRAGLTRRRLLGLGTGLATGLSSSVLAGCSSPFDQTTRTGGRELEFVTFYTGADGPVMQQIVDRYNRSQDEVVVRMSAPAYGDDYLTKLMTAAIAGAPPAIIAVHSEELPPLARFLHELDLAELGLRREDFRDETWELPTYEGKLLGLTMSTGPLALGYNKALFRQAGLDPEQPPTNRAEFVEVGKAMRQIDRWGFVREPESWMPWLTFNWQAGGQILSPDGRALFDSPEAIAAAGLERDIFGRYETGYPEFLPAGTESALFDTGRVAMMVIGPWSLTTLVERNETEGTDFGWAAMPQFFDGPRAVASTSHIYCVPKQRNNDDWIRERASRFISWLLREGSLQWAQSQAPTNRRVLDQMASSDNPLVRAMTLWVEESEHARFKPYAPRWNEAYTVLVEAIQRIIYRQAPLEETMRATARRANQILRDAS